MNARLPAEPEPPREELDWDAWLGPAPWRPYNSRYVRGGWHGQYDFHTSCIGEWGSHTFAQCHVALGLGHSAPVFYGYVNNETSDGMVMRFANGVEMVSQRTGWHGSCGVRFEGSEGWVACADGYQRPEVSRPSLLADYTKLVNDYQARTGRQGTMRNFSTACVRRNRGGCRGHALPMADCCGKHRWAETRMRFDPVRTVHQRPEAVCVRARSSAVANLTFECESRRRMKTITHLLFACCLFAAAGGGTSLKRRSSRRYRWRVDAPSKNDACMNWDAWAPGGGIPGAGGR